MRARYPPIPVRSRTGLSSGRAKGADCGLQIPEYHRKTVYIVWRDLFQRQMQRYVRRPHRLPTPQCLFIRRHGLPLSFYAQKSSSTPKFKRAESAQSLGVSRTLAATALVFGTGVIIWAFVFSSSTTRNSPSNPGIFASFTIISKEAASSNSSIFVLRPSSLPSSDQFFDAWRKGILSVQVKQPQLQIGRSYSPLPPSPKAEFTGELRFLIRQEPQGEVSTYLHKLPVGAVIELRGPRIEYEIPKDVGEIIFLAGGTGVAPALQTIYNLFECRKDTDFVPKLRILWANRRSEDSFGGTSDTPPPSSNRSSQWPSLFGFRDVSQPEKRQVSPEISISPIVKELDSFKKRNGCHLTIDYFVDEENSHITEETLRSYLSKSAAESSSARRRLILISGPEGFVTHHAGPKEWGGGKELQGPIGGTLGNISPDGWEIWKL